MFQFSSNSLWTSVLLCFIKHILYMYINVLFCVKLSVALVVMDHLSSQKELTVDLDIWNIYIPDVGNIKLTPWQVWESCNVSDVLKSHKLWHCWGVRSCNKVQGEFLFSSLHNGMFFTDLCKSLFLSHWVSDWDNSFCYDLLSSLIREICLIK